MRFLIENFSISKGMHQGRERFSGFFAFEIEGTDAIIIEKFFDRVEGGEYVLAKEAATYVLHRDALNDLARQFIREDGTYGKELDLSIASLFQGYKDGKGSLLIQRVFHNKDSYYDDLMRAVGVVNLITERKDLEAEVDEYYRKISELSSSPENEAAVTECLGNINAGQQLMGEIDKVLSGYKKREKGIKQNGKDNNIPRSDSDVNR